MRSENFKKLLEKTPDNLLLQFSLGQALFDEGKIDACVEPLKKCIQERKDWMIPHILLGKALLHQSDSDNAKAYLQKALQLAREQEHESPEIEILSLLEGL